MKKADLINSICEMQPNIPRTLLSKKDFPKKTLEDLYKRLVNGQEYADCLDQDHSRKKRDKQKPKKKPVKIIEFSDSDVEEEPEKVEKKKQEPKQVEEELPSVSPPLVRQNANVPVQEPVEEKKPKLNKIKIKKEIKELLIPFIKEVKDLLFEYKTNKDDDYLLDHYNLLLRDQEEIFQEYLVSIDAPDDIYNYAADLLSVHTSKIERLVN